jgi:hypothetical protein
MARRWWSRAGVRRVAAAEAVQVTLGREFTARIAELPDLTEQRGGVAFTFVPAQMVAGPGVGQMSALLGLGDQVIEAPPVANLRTAAWRSPSLRPIAASDCPWRTAAAP